jgi:hypothetical protein
VKRRSRELTRLFEQIHPYKGRVGQRTKILVTDKAPDGIHYVGRTKAYEQVLIPKDKRVMGKLIEVEITEERKFEMFGRVIEESIQLAPVRPPPLQTYSLSLSHSLILSFTLSFSFSFSLFLSFTLTLSLSHSLSHSLIHSLTLSLSHSLSFSRYLCI